MSSTSELPPAAGWHQSSDVLTDHLHAGLLVRQNCEMTQASRRRFSRGKRLQHNMQLQHSYMSGCTISTVPKRLHSTQQCCIICQSAFCKHDQQQSWRPGFRFKTVNSTIASDHASEGFTHSHRLVTQAVCLAQHHCCSNTPSPQTMCRSSIIRVRLPLCPLLPPKKCQWKTS